MELIFNPLVYFFLFGGIVTCLVIRSKWKHPPRERKLQFAFAFSNFLFSSLITFIAGPILFLISIPSLPRLAACLFLLLVLIASFVSIFKPRFTVGIPFFWTLIFVALYFDNPKNLSKTSYRDICNELRIDPDCLETETSFNCTKPKFEKLKIIQKTRCLNTIGNDENKFTKVNSPFIGKTYDLKGSVALIKNLPRNDCMNRHCGYISDASLTDLHNMCSNCLDPKRLTTKLRVELLPKGTLLKVIGAYEVKEYSLISTASRIKYLVQDNRYRNFEVSKHDFEHFLLPGSRDITNEDEVTYEKHLNRIDTKGQTRFQVYQSFSQGDKGLHQFIKDFKLEGSLIPERIGSKFFVIIKDKEAFQTFAYFHHEWGISTKFTTDIQEKKELLRKFTSNFIAKPSYLHSEQMSELSNMLRNLEKESHEDYTSLLLELEAAISSPEQSKEQYKRVVQKINLALTEE